MAQSEASAGVGEDCLLDAFSAKQTRSDPSSEKNRCRRDKVASNAVVPAQPFHSI